MNLSRTSHNGPGHTWWLLLPAWLAACAARPFLLGFYDDDWFCLLLPAQAYDAWSLEMLAFHMNLFANRLTTGFVSFVMTSICGESAVAWHAAASVLLLGAAVSLRTFGRSLLRLLDLPALWAADVGAALWLLFPFHLGLSARLAQSPCILNILCFALSGAVLFHAWRNNRTAWFIPALLYLIGIQAYETLYGAFVVLLLIGLVANVPRRIGWRAYSMTAVALAGAQVLAIAWNRLTPYFTALAPHKQVVPDWQAVFLDNLIRLRYFIGHSVRELSPLTELVLFFVLVAGGVMAVWQLRRPSTRSTAGRTLLVSVSCVIGVLISLLVLTAAEYRLHGIGLVSRTATGPAFWLAVAVTLALGVTPRRARTLRTVTFGASVALMLLFAKAINDRLIEWGTAFEIQEQVLAEAPRVDLAAARPGAVVMYFGPEMYKGVRTFGHYHQLDQALYYRYPELEPLHFCCVARDNRITTWDGAHFWQECRQDDRRKVWNEFDTDEVWVWVRGTGRARRVSDSFVYKGATDNSCTPVFQVALPFKFEGDSPATGTDVAVTNP